MKLVVKFKKLHEFAKIPQKQTDGAAGMDLSARLDKSVVIDPGERVLVPTDLAMELPAGHVALVFPRSGIASKNGVTLANCVGVIDEDYRGNVQASMINLSRRPFVVDDGMRIAQMLVIKLADVDAKEATELSDTARGDGGFGSTKGC